MLNTLRNYTIGLIAYFPALNAFIILPASIYSGNTVTTVISSLFFAIGVSVYIPILYAVWKKGSLIAEIVTDFKYIVHMDGTTLAYVKGALSFLSFYHLIFPVAIYTIIRYRKVKTLVVDHEMLECQYDRVRHGSLTIFTMARRMVDFDIISQRDVVENFVLVGDRYFIKDQTAATYLTLSYSMITLCSAFGHGAEDFRDLIDTIGADVAYDIADKMFPITLKIV